MRPEDIDKIFKERLGPSSPTPPADLWNRLQDRIETEMPNAQPEQQKPKGFMFLSYSIAAVITLLLAVGIVFFQVERDASPTVDGIAHTTEQPTDEPVLITEPAPIQGIAQAAEPAKTESAEVLPVQPEVSAPEAKATTSSEKVARATIAKSTPKQTKPASRKAASEKIGPAQAQQIAKVEKPVIPDAPAKGDYYNTGEEVPARFASNNVDMNAQPVEIIIKRAVAIQPANEAEEMSGFEKKQKLAKNIFKQVRNLSNGERVELSELGIHADKIALETQIGKQKISKVINL